MGYVFILFGLFVTFSNIMELISGNFQVTTFILDSIFATCLFGFGFILTNIYKIQRIISSALPKEKITVAVDDEKEIKDKV